MRSEFIGNMHLKKYMGQSCSNYILIFANLFNDFEMLNLQEKSRFLEEIMTAFHGAY
jgi:hypothetical protein